MGMLNARSDNRNRGARVESEHVTTTPIALIIYLLSLSLNKKF